MPARPSPPAKADVASLFVAYVQKGLDAHADPGRKEWWERYLKRAMEFRGVRMADIRSVVREAYGAQALDGLTPEGRTSIALALLRQQVAEDKLAGILLLSERLLPAGDLAWESAIPEFATLFGEGAVADWNTCDWFCVKVLGPLAQGEGRRCVRAIMAWRDSAPLWQRRASAVAFVNLAKRGDDFYRGFVTELLKTCAVVAKSRERFAQSGVGWVVRELEAAAPGHVAKFIEKHGHLLTPDAMDTLHRGKRRGKTRQSG